MARFILTIEASTDLTTGADPLLEILVDGIAVSSSLITAQTGVGSDILVFTLDYDDSTNNYPSSLQFRFSSNSGDGNESVTIHDVRINGQALDRASDFSSDLTAVMLMQSDSVSLSSPSAHDHLFGREEPTSGNLGTVTNSGTTGDDKIVTGTGTDVIDADGGNDRVEARDGDDSINGGAGDDRLFGQDGNDTIIGGAGDDKIWGDSGGDNGDDLLFGQSGNDMLSGGAGNDILNGGAGNDILIAGSGDDILYGEAGDDRLIGQSGTNTMYGDSGDDILLGGNGDDTMYGGADDDTIHGAKGNDIIEGQDGLDFITGGDGSDIIDGGADDDVIRGGNDADEIFGGSGNDEIYGDHGNDTIEGDDGDDTIDGGAGNDTIEGGNGDDTIDGGADDDNINGGLGADILTGGAGNDTINGAGITNETEPFFATAADLLSYGGGQDAGGSLSVIENGDGFIMDGNLWKKVLVNYTVTADTIIEFDFKSTLEAEISGVGFDNDNNISAGNTFKVFGTQNWGITAFDNYTGSSDWEHFTIDVGSYFTGTFSHLVFMNDDDGNAPSNGTDGNSWFRNFKIYDVGNIDDASNTLNGGDGNDILIAGNQGDTLNGGNNNDTLNGGGGADTLNGDAGDDTINSASTIDASITSILSANSEAIVRADGWIFHSYTSTGAHTFTAPTGVTQVDYLAVGGGGGGGGFVSGNTGGGGGGGAGEVDEVTGYAVTAGNNYAIAVGAGGAGGVGGTSMAGTGGTSSFDGNTALGGGGGGTNGVQNNGNSGASGGGGRLTGTGASGTDGNAGGNGSGGTVGTAAAGGGGGAGAAGANASGNNGGDGGDGVTSAITGETIYYGGGGGGGAYLGSGTGGTGGAGGGGTAPNSRAAGTDGLDGRGGGGSGATGSNGTGAFDGGDGGDGIVIVAYDSGATFDVTRVSGGTGNDDLYGSAGMEIFEFSNTGTANTDTVYNFNTQIDKLDLSDLLTGYDPLTELITDFVQITDSGGDSDVRVDTTGSASFGAATVVATIDGITGLTDEAFLEVAGVIITS